jgi:hypothetical protein
MATPTTKNANGKIALPWGTEVSQRYKYTKVYWHLSRAWNGHPAPNYTVCDALDDVSLILRNTDPNAPLARITGNLKDDVVTYGSKAAKKKAVAAQK